MRADLVGEATGQPGSARTTERERFKLSRMISMIAPGVRGEVVYELFRSYPDLNGVIVSRGNEVEGLIGRQGFLVRMGWQYGWALYARERADQLMRPDPLTVPEGASLQAIVGEMQHAHGDAWSDGYVVRRADGGFGVESGEDLLARLVRHLDGEKQRLLVEKARAIEANASKTSFLANMSHELRTPLNAILGFSEIIASGGMPSEKNTEYANDIVASGQYLLALINDLLDFSSSEAGKRPLDMRNIEVREPVHRAVRLVGPMALDREITLLVDESEHLGTAYGDLRAVTQILVNLLNNAVKFSPRGSMVRVEVVRLRREVEIAIEDRGPGIDKDDQDRIFMPFERLENHLTSRVEGSGLGLAICQQLAAQMAGRLALRSAPGEGSRFSLILACEGAETPSDEISEDETEREAAMDSSAQALPPEMQVLKAMWETTARGSSGLPLLDQVSDRTIRDHSPFMSAFREGKSGDFLLLCEGAEIVDLVGRRWSGHFSSEIDATYGRGLTKDLTQALEWRQPMRSGWQTYFSTPEKRADRLLLPFEDGESGSRVILSLLVPMP